MSQALTGFQRGGAAPCVLGVSEWHPIARAAALVAMLGACGGGVHAAQAQTTWVPAPDPCPNCDRSVAQNTPSSVQGLPATPMPATALRSFRLNSVRLNGADAITADELRSITDAYTGRDVTLTDLEALAQAITQRYRERGYFLAQAVVPVQTVQGGVVDISVIEGKMGNIEVLIEPNTPLPEERVRGFLALLPPGQAVNAPDYERAMLLLSDQPGVRVSSGLQQGAQPGTTDLTVEVVAGPRASFAIETDNHGTQESGRYRLGGTARWLSPLGMGDNLDARLTVSNNNALQFGRLSYEAPLGGDGWRVGVGVSRVNYELTGEFEPLGAQGRADVVDISLNYPLIRQRQHNLFLRLSAESKQLTDEFTEVNYEAKKRIQGFGLGWTWERRDKLLGGGYWASSGTLYHGSLSLRDTDFLGYDQSAVGRKTAGNFSKLTMQVSRLQAIVPQQALYLSVGGQRASKNLDASEKLSLGGARSVRAYSSAEALVDEGLIGTLEWRWSVNPELTPFLFYDAARGHYARQPTAFDTDNQVSLRGYGLGLSWSRPSSFSINATLAWRDGTRRAIADGGGHQPRLYVQVQKVF